MSEIGFVVIGIDANAEKFNFAWQGYRFEIRQLGDFAVVQIEAIEIGRLLRSDEKRSFRSFACQPGFVNKRTKRDEGFYLETWLRLPEMDYCRTYIDHNNPF